MKHSVTLTELREWLLFLEWNETRHAKQDYYLAQIAAEIRRGNVKHGARIKVRDFLLRFSAPVSSRQDRLHRSKAAWAAALRLEIRKEE